MDSYVQTILKEKEQQNKNVLNELSSFGNIPDLRNPTKKIPLIDELIIKITFLHKIFFLTELVELFNFSYTKNQLEKIVIELEESGYIKSEIDNEYGKYFSLTKEALYYIKGNSIESKFPIDLISYKCKSRITSMFVFIEQANMLYGKFANETKQYRVEYAKVQYIKHFIYKKFLQSTKADKESLLIELGFSQTDISKYSRSRIFSNSFSDVFVNQYISFKGFDSLDNLEDFQKFRLAINTYCFRKQTRNQKMLCHFLKDYHNLIMGDKKEYLKSTYQLILNMNSTYRYNGAEQTIKYLKDNGNADIYIYQCELNRLLEIVKFLTIKKRNLINSNAKDKNKSISELQTLNNQIDEMEKEIECYNKQLKFIMQKFQFMTYEKSHINGLVDFKENEITLNKLVSKNIYISEIAKASEHKIKVQFAIVQTSSDAFYIESLFTKIEWIFLFYYHILKDYDYEISIYTFGEIRKSDIESALVQVKEKFSYIKEYSILHAIFDNLINIVNCRMKNQERYESYNFIKSEMDKLS